MNSQRFACLAWIFGWLLCIAFGVCFKTELRAQDSVTEKIEIEGQTAVASDENDESLDKLESIKQKFLSAKRVVFLGDSNTHAGEYVSQIESRLLAQFRKSPEIINLGLSSETCSGLSEPAHPFPRPNVHERLTRILDKTQPDLVVACYGMNDAIYHPFDETRFKAFRDGVHKLIEAHAGANVPLVLLTPPPFDPLPVRVAGKLVSAESDEFLWTKVYEHYDEEVIKKYAQWMMTLKEPDCLVIDMHTPVNEYLAERRKSEPNFAFSNDGVHFDKTGHSVFAGVLLGGIGVEQPAVVDSELLALVRKRQAISHLAWLSDVGHLRPGMKAGLPLNEVEQKIAPFSKKIDAILKSN